MKKTKIILLCLCIGLVSTACAQKNIPVLQDGKEVVAELDGKKITAEDLYNELKIQGGTSTLISLIDTYITNKEIKDDTEATKYANSQIENYKAQFGDSFKETIIGAGYKDEQALRDAIISDYKKSQITEKYIKESFTDKEINNYYKDEITGEMTVRYILVKPDVTDNMTSSEKTEKENEALATAKEVIAKLKKGEKFEDLAKKYSDDATTAGEGGLYSNFIKGDVVEEFWDASVALKDGKYTTTPVKSSYGYFVILRVSQKDKPKLDDVKSTIIDGLYAKKIDEDETATSKIWVEIRKKYNLDILDTTLKTDYNEAIKTLK